MHIKRLKKDLNQVEEDFQGQRVCIYEIRSIGGMFSFFEKKKRSRKGKAKKAHIWSNFVAKCEILSIFVLERTYEEKYFFKRKLKKNIF